MTVSAITTRTPQGETAVKSGGVGARLLFIDNLRWVMIVLVVLVHLAVTYSQVGSWYYVERRPAGAVSKLVFLIFQACTQAYFMGFLFFIAGYFVPGAYDKKGPRRFITDRLIRLGLPTLVYMLLLHPATIMILRHGEGHDALGVLREYPRYLATLRFVGSSGPLWFALALLIFSAVYAGVRGLGDRREASRKQAGGSGALSHGLIATLALLAAVLTFLVRLVQPVGTSVLNMQLCFFTQYIFMFTLGVAAYRGDVLRRLPYAFGMAWFKGALFLGIPILVGLGALGGPELTPLLGAWHWQAAATALWEMFFCAGVCLGLLVLFRDKLDWQGRLAQYLSHNAFGVYVFHAPILVGLTLWARGITWPPLAKFAVMAALALPACFACSGLIRRVPLMRRIFS